MEILYSRSGGPPIACYRLRRRPFELCARGTTPVSWWRPCAAPDRPSRRPTTLGPSPVYTTTKYRRGREIVTLAGKRNDDDGRKLYYTQFARIERSTVFSGERTINRTFSDP